MAKWGTSHRLFTMYLTKRSGVNPQLLSWLLISCFSLGQYCAKNHSKGTWRYVKDYKLENLLLSEVTLRLAGEVYCISCWCISENIFAFLLGGRA